jgi:hypothetical protein
MNVPLSQLPATLATLWPRAARDWPAALRASSPRTPATRVPAPADLAAGAGSTYSVERFCISRATSAPDLSATLSLPPPPPHPATTAASAAALPRMIMFMCCSLGL